MKTYELKKIAIILLVVLLVANLALFALKLISTLVFWAIIIIVAVIAYKDVIKRWIKA